MTCPPCGGSQKPQRRESGRRLAGTSRASTAAR
nr:MAG TPA: rubredoxin-like protein [Caudoviricetes sp.]